MFLTFKGRMTTTSKWIYYSSHSVTSSALPERPICFSTLKVVSSWSVVANQETGWKSCRCEKLFQCGMSLLAAEGTARESVSLHFLVVGITVRNQIYCLLASFYDFDYLQILICCNYCWCFWIFNKHLIRIQVWMFKFLHRFIIFYWREVDTSGNFVWLLVIQDLQGSFPSYYLSSFKLLNIDATTTSKFRL